MNQEHPSAAHPPGTPADAASSLYTSFPYGLSGVSVSEPSYYADYGRKSRMCMYCGKVFTRSTTRRYHEVKCRSKRKTGDYTTNNQIPHAILSEVNFSPSSSHQSSPLDFPPSSTPDLGRNLNASMFGTSPPLPPTRPLEMKGYESDHADVVRKSPGHLDDYRKDPDRDLEHQPIVSNGAEEMINSPITSPVSPPQVEKETIESVLGINSSAGPMTIPRTSPLPTFPIVSMANMASMVSLANFHEQAAILRNSPPINNLGQHVMPPFSSDMLLAASNVMAAMNFPWRPEESMERRYNVGSPPLEPFRCEICGKVLQSANQLTIHKRTHMKVRPYPCRICGSRFTTLSSRRSHERTHLGEKPYFCVVCGTRFTRKYSLKLHENKHVDGPYKCSHCFKMCNTVMDLKDHLQCHTMPEKPGDDELKSPPLVELSLPPPPNTSTPTSTSTTATTSSTPADDQPQDKDTLLSPKLETKDSDDEVSDSNDNSSSSDAMIDGKALSDSCGGDDGDKIQRCSQCGEEFPHAYLLKIHVKVHASKPFECPVCGKKFGYRNNMKTHVKCHFGLKPHVCQICGSRFTRASTLRRHIEKHQAQGDSSNLCFGSSPIDSQASVSVSTSNIVASALTSAISPTNAHIKNPGPMWLPPERASSEPSETFEPLPAFSTFQSLATSASYPIRPSSMIPLPQLAINPESPPQTQALNLSVTPAREESLEEPKDWSKSGDKENSDIGEDYEVGNNNNNISKRDSCERDREPVSLQPQVSSESVGVQVNTCGCSLLLGSDCSPPKLDKELSSSEDPCRIPKNLLEPSLSPASSVSQAQEEFNSQRTRTLLALVQTGQLFTCEFCECYFTEYAMLRIHKKMHAMGAHHPFVCSMCGEDCHDKVYFALHMSEHLK